MGPVDPATLPKTVQEKSEEEKRIEKARELLPPPAAAINLHDIEVTNAGRLLRAGGSPCATEICSNCVDCDGMGILSIGRGR